MDSNLLLDYISSLLPPNLDPTFDSQTLQLFLESHVPDSLYAICNSNAKTLRITNDLETIDQGSDSLVILIKSKEPVTSPAQIELVIIPLSGSDPHEIFGKFRAIISLGLAPMFESLSLNSKDSFVNNTRRKFTELSTSLQNLQEKIQVPDLLVSVHPVIKSFPDVIESFDDLINDTKLLNEVTTIVNNWTRQISSITNLSSENSSLQEEIQFWNSLDISIGTIEEQLNSHEVKNSINLLNRANRFHVTLSFSNDTQLVAKKLETKTNLLLLKDLPLNDLNINVKDADCFIKYTDLVLAIFNHLKRLRSVNNFPLTKATLLTELVLKEVLDKFCHLLSGKQLLTMDFEEFLNLQQDQIPEALNTIDLNVKYMINLIRELLRKRQEKFFIVRINEDYLDKIKHRLSSLLLFRRQHENMVFIIRNFLLDSDQEPKLTEEYNRLAVLNAFDFSKHGSYNWSSTERLYNHVYKTIQSMIVNKLNDLFMPCTTFKDYVSVADKYKYLKVEDIFDILELMREELRLEVLDIARVEVSNFIKFDLSFGTQVISGLSHHLGAYSEPKTVQGEYLRALAIRERLNYYQHNLASLVGKDWSKYSIGAKLADQILDVSNKYDPQKVFDSFIESVTEFLQSHKAEIKGKIFKTLVKDEGDDIVINVDHQVLDLRKTVKFFHNLRLKIPVTLLLEFQKLDKLLPVVRDIDEKLSTIKRIFKYTLPKPCYVHFHLLIQEDKQKIMSLFEDMAEVHWEYISQAIDSKGIEQNEALIEVRSLNKLLRFQEFVDSWSLKLNIISRLHSFLNNQVYHRLKLCDYSENGFNEVLSNLTLKIEELYNIGDRSQLFIHVNEELSKVINIRCSEALESFESLLSLDKNGSIEVTAQIIVKDQVITMNPSISEMKTLLVARIDSIVNIAERQTLLQGQSLKLQGDKISAPVAKAFKAISSLMQEVEAYYGYWQAVNSLIDLDLETDHHSLSPTGSLEEWCLSVQEVIKLGDLFDDEIIRFGCLEVSLGAVQSKVSMRFERARHDTIKRFSHVYDADIREFEKHLRTTSSSLAFDSMDNKNFLVNLLAYFNTKDLVDSQWNKKLSLINDCFKILTDFGFKFPNKWVYPEQIENLITVIRSVVEKKKLVIDENLNFITSKVSGLSIELSENIIKLKDEWNTKKPISGDMNPILVLNSLNNFRSTVSSYMKLKQDLQFVSNKLECQIPEIDTQVLEDMGVEISNFKNVWSSINTLHNLIEQLRQVKWNDVKIKDVRLKLDDLLTNCRQLPIKIRQYSAFDDIQQTTKDLVKQHKILVDLKNPNVKDRHWKKLLSSIGYAGKSYQLFTLGDIWNLNLLSHESSVKAIVVQANNENTLEENIEKIKEKWNQISFEYFNFNTKFKLIKSWNLIFENCTQDLNELQSMRSSSSFSTFEQDILQLESKLNSLYLVLDIWIEVQRQWVYLNGIFSSRNGISNILPVESSRFNNLTYTFFDLMKKVYNLELAIDVLLIGDFNETLDKLLESFSKLRRSLSEFLEKQRDKFARFFFIGSDDLLELIGSGTDFNKINAHILKLFSAVGSLQYDSNSSCIISLTSTEGEVLKLSEPVSLLKYPGLIDWLSQLELEIKLTIASLVKEKLPVLRKLYEAPSKLEIIEIIDSVPDQVINLCYQIVFTEHLDQGIISEAVTKSIDIISELAPSAVSVQRQKIQNLLVELVHQADVFASMKESPSKVSLIKSTELLYHLSNDADLLKTLTVKQMGASFTYGFEYIGVPQRLVHTPLTNKCFVALTQALNQKLGGSPFGPAGTGKTESVKALGDYLGRMVVVFCCDDTFDFGAMSRIFLGLCKVGCWGCFDEFNRLDDKLLSAVSSQIEVIEIGLRDSLTIEISGKSLQVDNQTGIFVTMNPGYVGRNELPENLKKLFVDVSMDKPDQEVIVDVLLASQGFKNTKGLARKIVPFFQELKALATDQTHYDFGLRALKAVLQNSGKLIKSTESEDLIMYRSLCETVLPKLVKQDESIFEALKAKYFADIQPGDFEDTKLVDALLLLHSKGLDVKGPWVQKVLQLNQLSDIHHGIIMVGESGSGKSTCWETLLEVTKETTGTDYVVFKIDAKVLTKQTLYGSLDTVTREWTDGLFTNILRKVKLNLRGEMNKKVWIVFDCDIDPEWAENLNSVLDDNKILTLPNGERLELPDNVKIIFETDNLENATLATITRCGMIWFDRDTVGPESLLMNKLHQMLVKSMNLEEDIDELVIVKFQSDFVLVVKELMHNNLEWIMNESNKFEHIMDYDIHRYVNSFINLLQSYMRKLCIHCSREDIDITSCHQYIVKSVLLSVIWSFAGDSGLDQREEFAGIMMNSPMFDSIENISDVIENDIATPNGEWIEWSSQLQFNELEPHQVADPSTVVRTTDIAHHESLIHSVLNEHKPLLLCGPPGSGKTMTFLEVLKNAPGLDVLQLNFSKESSPELLMRSLRQYCEYQRTLNGIMFTPKVSGKWVVVFCDEINLPGVDKYNCQKVISLMRQMIEHNGFWDANEMQWIELYNIQFVGACNSPKDPGRQRLSNRFSRHVNLVMVDYPGETSLYQIYETFMAAVMKYAPDLRGYNKSITRAMIDVYQKSKKRMTPDVQRHYIYSPRELTRWSRGLLEALKSNTYTQLPDFIRIWYHEGLRLFYDRLVDEKDKSWTKDLFKSVIEECFPFADTSTIMKEPVLFSDWLSLNYESVDKQELYKFIQHRLVTFSDEEFNVDLVLYEDFLDHALRVDRVLRQPQGHMILVGPSSSGKTTITKFVAWMNGLKSVQLNVYTNFGIAEFDKGLRDILLRCARGEKICYIIDEASIVEASFIERMNTLLANSEVPGLFEGDDFKSLMNVCLEESQAQGLLLDSNDELYKWFSDQISTNLHVVFTLNQLDDSSRLQVVSSPALFNRCVLSYMGDWSTETLIEIATKKTDSLPVDISNFNVPDTYVSCVDRSVHTFREAMVDCFIYVHKSIKGTQYSSQFMGLIDLFTEFFNQKREELDESQRHTTTGLNKLRETVLQVAQLKEQLSKKQKELNLKDSEARKMLNTMLTEQNEAERKQEFSITAQEELNKQEIEIETRKQGAMKQLEEAEPAILEARKGVQNIKKQHLTEIRSMSNPPNAVKMTMESVCILIGYQVQSWRDVQLAIRKDDFIPSIVNYDNETQLTSELRAYMEKTYLSRPDYTFEVVNRASKSCGPLIQWVKAQLLYSSALDRVGPLREEVEILEHGAKKTRVQLIALKEMVRELEDSIEQYKNDYSGLIRETENIKMEMESVQDKVSKSKKLMESLSQEKDRWKKSIELFVKENDKLVGDTLIAAAFIVYCGKFDKRERESLLEDWKKQLRSIGISYEDAVSVANLVPSSSSLSLKIDTSNDLLLDNAVITSNTKVPLIIDPTMEMMDLLSSTTKIATTSFLNQLFVRDLENAVRFGGTIIVLDFEYYNPILDPILRFEVHRNGGRRMIRIGNQLLDFDERFKLYLHTRDPSVHIPSFVEARVSVVNFTITSRNFESQILSLSLKETQPDTESKRSHLIQLQHEYRVKLKTLQQELLDSLAEVGGSILDDDVVIKNLESLKIELQSIDTQLEESKLVLEKINQVRSKFHDVAELLALMYEMISDISSFNVFYTISLDKLKQSFLLVLKRNPENIIEELYQEVYSVLSPSLMGVDKAVLAVGLTVLYHSREIGDHFKSTAKEIFRTIGTGCEQIDMSSILSSLLIKFDRDIEQVMKDNPENPVLDKLYPILGSMYRMSQEPHELNDKMADFASFLSTGTGPYSSKYGLEYFIDNGEKPILLSSAEGYDPTFRIEQLANARNEKLTVISLGSKEGVESAKKTLNSNKSWVVLQNIQMSPEWLNDVEKLVKNRKYVFLTCSLSSKIPVTLVDNCQVMMYENQPELKQNISDTFGYMNLQSKPIEFRYIYFLLCWFHSVIITRMSYAPKSFQKSYSIRDNDFMFAIQAIEELLLPYMDLKNIPMEKIPFEEIEFLVGQIFYGGKIDNTADWNYVTALCGRLFNEGSFENLFGLTDGVSRPEGVDVIAYESWISELPDTAPLKWIDLDTDAIKYKMFEYVRRVGEGVELIVD